MFAVTNHRAEGEGSQHQGGPVHTRSLLHRTRHRARGANIKVAQCTQVRCYTERGTGQGEPTSRWPSAHTFAVTQNAAQGDGSQHRRDSQAAKVRKKEYTTRKMLLTSLQSYKDARPRLPL